METDTSRPILRFEQTQSEVLSGPLQFELRAGEIALVEKPLMPSVLDLMTAQAPVFSGEVMIAGLPPGCWTLPELHCRLRVLQPIARMEVGSAERATRRFDDSNGDISEAHKAGFRSAYKRMLRYVDAEQAGASSILHGSPEWLNFVDLLSPIPESVQLLVVSDIFDRWQPSVTCAALTALRAFAGERRLAVLTDSACESFVFDQWLAVPQQNKMAIANRQESLAQSLRAQS